MNNNLLTIIRLLVLLPISVFAQEQTLTENVTVSVEGSVTASSGDFAPLWLSSNRQGVVSPYANSAYERISAVRPMNTDSTRTWRRGYGIDLQLAQNAQSKFFIHQAYLELGYKKLNLTIGSKEREIDFRNNELTSGGLSQGINAHPIPMALFDIDYFKVTDWWKMKLRIGYGMTTDGKWQEEWIGDREKMRYTSNHLYHEKAMFWKFNFKKSLPLTLDVGVQMFTQFGGKSYNIFGIRGFEGGTVENSNNFWKAFFPFGSSDITDGTEKNVAGNIIGSYNAALTWKGTNGWQIRGYWEHMFEDHSQMFYQYPWYDHLAGLDIQFARNPYISHLLVEHMSSKDQSGPVYHDPTPSMPDKIFGHDNYYNHNLYSGWQHWGMGLGTPLIIAPIYNKDHELSFKSNRTQAWHIGIDGHPTKDISWKILMTWTRDWGIYQMPYDEIVNQRHFMLGLTYTPKWSKGLSGVINCGYTKSDILTNTFGTQVTIRKDFKL